MTSLSVITNTPIKELFADDIFFFLFASECQFIGIQSIVMGITLNNFLLTLQQMILTVDIALSLKICYGIFA